MRIHEILKEDNITDIGESGLPRWVENEFYKVADDQRGAPENAMLKVQFKMGGGVLNPVVEHVGDISNRMYKDIKWAHFQRNNVLDKATKTHAWLTNDYGFEREFKENIISNARYRKVDATLLKKEIDELLLNYAHEHSKLPAYSLPQLHAIEAAICIGKQKWKEAILHLEYLINLASNPEKYEKAVREYSLDEHGKLVELPKQA